VFKLISHIIFCILFFYSCRNIEEKNVISLKDDFNSIIDDNTLIAITQNNSTDYFIYKGEPMGFQYELLKIFSEKLKLKLEVNVENDINKMFSSLNNSECDIIALNLTNTKERKKLINFTVPIIQTRQVLVQRKPDKWQQLSNKAIDKQIIRNVLDLANKTIYVQGGAVYISRLRTLSDEIGDTIYIKEIEDIDTEEIISMVSNGEIDYTVCDENVGLINQTYHQNIDIKTPISFNQNIGWGVRKNSEQLLDTLNKWLVDFKKTKKYKELYNKYFRHVKGVGYSNTNYHSKKTGKVSEYDDLIKIQSKIINWDWKLLASLIYQESKFIPDLKSWTGAFGIMQLIPSTAERYGIDTCSTLEENLEAGTKYIKWIEEQLEDIEDDNQRIKFTLASYNVGLGHVLDARRLAEKNGKNPNQWDDNVDYFLLHKSNPKFYRDSVVKHGYCRGEEPYNYVTSIIERFEHYKNVIKEK